MSELPPAGDQISAGASPSRSSGTAKAGLFQTTAERRPRIAIVAALEREVRPLVCDWRRLEREHGGRRFQFFESEGVVVVCEGIGAEAARRAAEAVIVLYRPSIVYSAGYAGALDPRLKVGKVVRPARIVDSSDGSSIEIAGGEGVLVSYGAVASPKQKAKLADSFRAQALDMEAAAVARAAEARGVEFGAVKVISDEVDFEFPQMERFVDSQGRFREGRFAVFAMLRPWLWPKVIRMGRNASIATRVLCDQLQQTT